MPSSSSHDHLEKKMHDILHVLVRVVSHLYWHTAQKHCNNKEELEEMKDWVLRNLKVKVNSKKRLTKDRDTVNIGKRKESFVGK